MVYTAHKLGDGYIVTKPSPRFGPQWMEVVSTAENIKDATAEAKADADKNNLDFELVQE